LICAKKLTSKFYQGQVQQGAQCDGGRKGLNFYCFVEVAAKANENETENVWK